MNGKISVFALCLLGSIVVGVAQAQVKYPEVQVVKFKSGKVQVRTTLIAYGEASESEAFFENGQMRYRYKRVSKSPDPYHSDVYKFSQWNDRGKVVREGTCDISATRDFSGLESCNTFTGAYTPYDDNEKLLEESKYKKGQLDGESVVYSDDKVTRTNYVDGRKTKRVELDAKTKAVLKTEEYLEDGSRK